MNKPDNPPDKVMCPLVDEEIEDIVCLENRACVDKELVMSCMLERFKQKENFKDICMNCKWHYY